ncbi:MAG TPA: hypothetical protein VN426_05270 [Syntrophomonadaceae bacterium]|nr:hypothetical protein [Syntrophomonadaceae bacterium]
MKRLFSIPFILLAAMLILNVMPQPVLASHTISALGASSNQSTGAVIVSGKVDSDKGVARVICVQVTDPSGNVLYAGNLSTIADGSFTITCNPGQLQAGDYLVKATVDGGDMPAVAFFSVSDTFSNTSAASADAGAPSEVVISLLSPPKVAITSPASNNPSTSDTAITISASGSGCDHMQASYTNPGGTVTWLATQSGNSYSASFTPQLSSTGNYTVTVYGRNTPNTTDPGSLSTSASRTIAVGLPTPTIKLISPSDSVDASIYPPGKITISAIGTGCDHMQACIIKGSESTWLEVQSGNSYNVSITETENAEYLIVVYGRNTPNATDPGSKQTSKSAYIWVKSK